MNQQIAYKKKCIFITRRVINSSPSMITVGAINLLSRQSSVRYVNEQATQLKNATKGSVRIVMVKVTVTLSALAITTARTTSTTKESKHDYMAIFLYRVVSLRG